MDFFAIVKDAMDAILKMKLGYKSRFSVPLDPARGIQQSREVNERFVEGFLSKEIVMEIKVNMTLPSCWECEWLLFMERIPAHLKCKLSFINDKIYIKQEPWCPL